MESFETFSFVKDCLLKYNYPLVHSMSESEIADVFSRSNRCFLIAWILKLLDNEYKNILENSENDKELLSNLLYELGFCSSKEKLPFITGELPVTRQVKIIFNIFTFISDLNKCKEDEPKVTVGCDELIALTNKDLNLFPMYGEIKLRKPSERTLKLAELEKEIDEIKQSESHEFKCQLLDTNFKEELLEFIDLLKIDFPKIKCAIENITESNTTESCKFAELKPNPVETLKKCCENLNIISQFVKDIKTMEDFEKFNDKLNVQNRDNINGIFNMVKALHRDLFTVLKSNRCL